MPLENRYSNNYDPSQGIAQGIGSLGQILAQAPRIRAQGALMQAQTGRYNAMANQANAHGRLYDQLGLKNEDELQAAQGIAEEFKSGGVVTNQDGSLTIAPDSLSRIAGLMARTGKGASDIGGGLQKLFGTANAPTEEAAGRQNKIDVARVRPVVLNQGQTAVSNDPTQQVDPNTGDPSGGGIGSVIATAPPRPAAAIPPDTQTIRQDINPAYKDNTNLPPFINLTNTTKRITSPVAVAPKALQPAPAPQQRQPNQVYQTPKGALKWTGTGWVQP